MCTTYVNSITMGSIIPAIMYLRVTPTYSGTSLGAQTTATFR